MTQLAAANGSPKGIFENYDSIRLFIIVFHDIHLFILDQSIYEHNREKKDSRKQPRGKGDGRTQRNEKKRVERRNHKDDERESTSNMKPRDGEESRGPKKRSRNRNRNKRGERTNETNPRKNRRTDNGKKKKIPEKKGISGFLSKLFGK